MKKVISICLMICLIVVNIFPVLAETSDDSVAKTDTEKLSNSGYSGTCGDTAKWTLSGTTLKITGTGDMFDYTSGGCSSRPLPWEEHRNIITSVAIGSGITSIGGEAFRDCSALVRVTIGNKVKYIHDSAFRNCKKLRVVKMGKSVEAIGDYAFEGCTVLRDFTIPGSLKAIGKDTFAGCTFLDTGKINTAIKNAKQTTETQKTEIKYKLSSAKLTMIKGKTETLKILSDQKINKVTWKSSKTSVATVSTKGVIKAKKAGKTTITAKVGKTVKKCIVTVKNPYVKLSAKTVTLQEGAKKTLIASTNGASKSYIWKSSNPTVATVDRKGCITAKKSGTATVVVTVNGVTARCKVTVQKAKTATKGEVVAAYKKFLSSNGKIFGQYRTHDINMVSFELAYLNNDSIPELIISSFPSSWIYTYRNGKMVLVDEVNGYIYYYSRTGYYYFPGISDMPHYDMTYKKWTGTTVQSYAKRKITWTSGSSYYYDYYVGNQVVGLSTYNQYVSPLEKKTAVYNYKFNNAENRNLYLR